MHIGNRARIRQLHVMLLLLMGTPLCIEAGSLRFWQLKDTAGAPVLVVGRVLSVQKGERIPDGSLPWKAETLAMTAEIQVLRSFTTSQKPISAEQLRVHFLAYGPSVTMFINGTPPPLPRIEPGEVLILPLQENENPASDLWQLVADSGVNLTIPARAEMPNSWPSPATARAFLNREIANDLSGGTSREVVAAAAYLGNQYEDLTGELMPLLEPVIGDEQQRWAEVATNFLGARGRPNVADLIAGRAKPQNWFQALAVAALQKLKASPETDNLLIKTWISEAPLHAEGSANSLLEFGDNPTTTETLRQALQNDLAGSSYIAWRLAQGGHLEVLPEAITRALKIADRPDAGQADLQSAVALLQDHGTDEQLKQLAALVHKYQTADRNFYYTLWQYATEFGNPREARVLAIVLRDRRFVSGETRYCDIAVSSLERAVRQDFGSAGKTMNERDAAVSRALAWIESQGLSN